MKDIKAIAEKIQNAAQDARLETARILSELVRIKSYSGQEEAVIKAIEKMCNEYGFDEVKIDDLGSLIVRIGNGKRILAIDAHIDTVETGDLSQWTRDPFSGDIDGPHVYGRGTSDQKGGAASMIAAGRILKQIAYDGDFSVYLTFTVLEEDCDGMCWKYLIEEEGLKPDFVVSTEPTSVQLYRGHRGRMEMQITLRGVSSHGSAPERGDSAAYKAARAALALERLNERLQPDKSGFLGKGTVVVSRIDVKGPSQCAVPDFATLYVDRRLTEGETADMAVAQVKKAVGDAIGVDPETVDVIIPHFAKRGWRDTDYGQELYFPTWTLPEDAELVQGGKEAYRALYGKDPVVDKWTFSTNLVAVSGRHGIPAIGFGPGDEREAHAPNEKTRIDDLTVSAAFYALLPYVLEYINT